MTRRSASKPEHDCQHCERPHEAWQCCPTIETLAAVIAHSQIVVAQPYSPMPSLPGDFDGADIAVLDWIAAEGRRVSRRLLLDVGRAVRAWLRAAAAQALAYVYFEEEKGRRTTAKLLTRDEARHIANEIVKLPELLVQTRGA